ncbi:DUF457 family protein [Natrialba magadii ATCC 43099]|uniref:DUF457 family protein n=2 Tax=Natrialba magadii (strain ATCC 43099 / DSM 3394 / CCM 3739 / CIP 104546 / IAM 13178 / JCM 8861 / NBRC 102185 / NCIMB 2190 / MS3) TaxID=547559 RepID=D3SSX5_NATMM|nr:DUF457 family protein [Natrialba magadii ATCC 43099]
MMATTHVFAGLALVAPVAYLAPEFSGPLALGAIAGGLAPDLDLPFTHRRTFHFPVAGVAPALGVVAFAVLSPASVTVGLAAFVAAAWLHAASDALGGGPEMDPWQNRTERAVYDHVHGRWIRPRRWIRYDGAPEDAVFATVLAVPALLVFDGWIVAAILGGLTVSLAYALLRRRLIHWTAEWEWLE